MVDGFPMKSFFAELKRRNVIRIAVFYGAGAWLILQVADVMLELLEAPEGSLRLIAGVLALGFPFALILSWAFEITPEGVRRESDLASAGRDGNQSARKLDIATIGLLVLAILLLLWSQFNVREGNLAGRAAPPATPVTPGEPRDLSIAVLPFVNMSADEDNEYFSDGLAEEVLNVLARMQDFRVAGRTSSFAFKGQQADLKAIGERLGVANILEGSVRKQGDQIRVTAQLVDARDGYHLWSDTYDRRLDDVFAIQDEIATEVVKALRRTLLDTDETVISQTAKGDVEAYNHYLRGQSNVRLRTPDGLQRALEQFQQAIVIDPGYAPPYAGVAMVYALLDNYGYRSLEQTGELAHRALERALALDPQSDEAWAVRGLLLTQGAGAKERLPEARAAFERALRINPNNAFAQLWSATTLLPDYEAASAAVRRAYELDPLSPVIVRRRAEAAIQWQDEAAFDRFMAELQQIAPDWFGTWQMKGSAAERSGRLADAALAFERVVEFNPDYAIGMVQLARVLHMLGHDARAQSLLQRALEHGASDEARIILAAMEASRAVLADEPGAALTIYSETIESLEAPPKEQLAELAMLEIKAGQADAAVQRLRALLGVGAGELPARPGKDTTMVLLAMASGLSAQGLDDEAARYRDALRSLLQDMTAQGLDQHHFPLVAGLLDYLEGDANALEAGMQASLRRGMRLPPGYLAWMVPLERGSAELQRILQPLRDLLAEERARYDRARAAR